MANKPKIRFKGFDDAWEQRKLGNVCSRVQGNDGRMELPTLTISASNGWMKQEDRFSGNIAGKEQKNYTLLHKGELSYNHGNSKLAKYGTVFSLQSYEEALVPRVYHSFKVEEGNTDFIEYYFATKLPDRELGKLISSGARMDGLLNIGYKEFMGIQLLFPKTKEQECIANYFRNLDHLITLHQRKCDQMKELKKYMLTKMFPQNGAKVPEIRFDGFTDDWEQRKLEDVMDTVSDYVAAGSFEDIRNNVTYLNEPGYAQLVRTVDLKKKFTNNDSVYVDESAFKYLWRVNLNDECIVLPNIGANIGEVYFVEPSSLPYDNNVLGPNAILLKANEDTYFAFTALNNLTFQKQLFENVGSSGQPKFNKTELKSIQLYMPQNEEQVKIGQYFRQLDHIITLHQHKCNELREIKKYMLKNMFI